MTIQFRHLSSLLRRKPQEMPRAEVPGLAYYTASENRPVSAKPEVVASLEMQALDAMYGYYTPQA